MPLTVSRSDGDRIAVAYRNGFHVDLPHWAGDDPDDLVASELRHWLKQRARNDVTAMAAIYGMRFGLAHLRERSHGSAFWEYLATLHPDWQSAKAWLDTHQTILAAEFLIR